MNFLRWLRRRKPLRKRLSLEAMNLWSWLSEFPDEAGRKVYTDLVRVARIFNARSLKETFDVVCELRNAGFITFYSSYELTRSTYLIITVVVKAHDAWNMSVAHEVAD